MQVRGTHNSYQPPLPPLERQLDEGIRQLELDVWSQPDGSFAVYHSANDRRSTCPTLVACLQPVRVWLGAHRQALPLYLVVENKGAPQDAGAVAVAVQAALPGHLLVGPKEVAGGRWPTLAGTRGRVIAVLIGNGAEQYTGGSMFVYASSGPLAAITSRPDPLSQAADIAAFVHAGLVVRTQADGDGVVLDEKRRDAAAASGAQIVSARDDGYLLPGGVSWRCDPLVPSPCRPRDMEPTTTTTTS
ncbi:MAG: phosphatidylinositol-specific phospholipase C domain-containing protein [Acidimicrobiia bacterium]|nr:phosphatidylinositol-specific phospholipase C domain-containing protein [Acidimicrobiia bacterium]MBV9043364.1 phosphatidylinositol-specific phospholipase C domain-containing protein [Acidimicrobiia bacterium]